MDKKQTECHIVNQQSFPLIVDYLKRLEEIIDNEKFSFSIFLLFAHKLCDINLPIEFEHRPNHESPDFILRNYSQNIEIGLEHTFASNEAFIIASKKAFGKGVNQGVIETNYYTGDKSLKPKNAFKGIKARDDKLDAPALSGEEWENDWIEAVKKALEKKSKIFHGSHFEICSRNDLLIQIDTPNEMFLNVKDIIPKLIESINDTNIPFDKVHVLSHSGEFIYDLFGKIQFLPIKKRDIDMFKTPPTI